MCLWRYQRTFGVDTRSCVRDRDGDPCARRTDLEIAGQPICRNHLLELATALLSPEHELLRMGAGVLTDAEEVIRFKRKLTARERSQRRWRKRAKAYARRTGDLIKIGACVDPRVKYGDSVIVSLRTVSTYRLNKVLKEHTELVKANTYVYTEEAEKALRATS